MADTGAASPKPFRVLPRVTPENEHFWRGGRDGALQFLRCQDCGYYLHPPAPVCPRCVRRGPAGGRERRGTNLAVEAVSGRATVHTYTVNHQPWIPTLDPPYVVAIVELAEQEGLRLTTNIVGCDPGDVRVGMAVAVTFDHYDDRGYEVWLPMFEPLVADDGGLGGDVGGAT